MPFITQDDLDRLKTEILSKLNRRFLNEEETTASPSDFNQEPADKEKINSTKKHEKKYLQKHNDYESYSMRDEDVIEPNRKEVESRKKVNFVDTLSDNQIRPMNKRPRVNSGSLASYKVQEEESECDESTNSNHTSKFK